MCCEGQYPHKAGMIPPNGGDNITSLLMKREAAYSLNFISPGRSPGETPIFHSSTGVGNLVNFTGIQRNHKYVAIFNANTAGRGRHKGQPFPIRRPDGTARPFRLHGSYLTFILTVPVHDPDIRVSI